MLDFRVYTFLAVCEYMNYTRAAEALHITQPAVSQHIRYLENMYQVKLFLAEGKKIHLSPAGERLLHAATTLKNDEVFLRKQMFEGAGKGLSLRFGTTRTIGESVISTPLARYIHSHPKDRISVVINNTDELLHKLVSGEIQFALVEDRAFHTCMCCRSCICRGAGPVKGPFRGTSAHTGAWVGNQGYPGEESGYQEYPPV